MSVDWEQYYKNRFQKFLNKRSERVEEKREKIMSQIMKDPQINPRKSHTRKIEERLLKEGEKYQDRLRLLQ